MVIYSLHPSHKKAPPLNGTGHTWHHSPDQLFQIIQYGYKKFDPNFHQAMLEVPTNEFEPGCICEVLQTGYKIYDRLLRPAMVGVSKKES